MTFTQYMTIYVLSMLVFLAIGYLICSRGCAGECAECDNEHDEYLRERARTVEKAAGSVALDMTAPQLRTIPTTWIRQIDMASGLGLDALAATYFPEVVRGGRADDQFRKELFRTYVQLHDLTVND